MIKKITIIIFLLFCVDVFAFKTSYKEFKLGQSYSKVLNIFKIKYKDSEYKKDEDRGQKLLALSPNNTSEKFIYFFFHIKTKKLYTIAIKFGHLDFNAYDALSIKVKKAFGTPTEVGPIKEYLFNAYRWWFSKKRYMNL
jgi:hypothetical protein